LAAQPDHRTQLENHAGLYITMMVRSATRRQLRQLTPADAAIVQSLQWGDKARLRADDEPVTPAVTYWEIGSEPELPQIPGFINNHRVAPEKYCSRYRTITRAMRAVDPTIKTGPCIMYATGPGADYLRALAGDPTTQVDFVSYHPYYYAMKNAWGDVPAMQTALQNFKHYLAGQANAVRQIFQTKNPAVQLIASEWDASSWDATPAQMLSMAEALGLAEGIFSFAEQGLATANYWEDPVGKPPCYMVFQAIQSHMGSRLLLSAGATPTNQDWRVYATCSPATRQLAVWGLNFNDRSARALQLRLANYPYRIARVASMALGVTNAVSHLQSNSHIAWRATDITKTFKSAGFTLNIDAATLKVLVVQAAR